MLYGIDVSHHQGAVDWAAVARDGIGFAVLKFTQGTSYGWTDWLRPNLAAAQHAGLFTGGYLFLMQSSPGDAQGGYYVDRAAAVGGLHGAHIIDCETAPGPEYPDARHVDAAARRIKAEIPGARVGMYTGRWYWGPALNDTGRDASVLHGPPVPDSIDYVWESRYVTGTLPWRLLAPRVPAGWVGAERIGGRRTDMLQFADHARVAGVAGDCDVNAYPGTREQLLALTGAAPTQEDISIVDAATRSYLDGKFGELVAKIQATGQRLAAVQAAVGLQADDEGNLTTTILGELVTAPAAVWYVRLVGRPERYEVVSGHARHLTYEEWVARGLSDDVTTPLDATVDAELLGQLGITPAA